MSAYISLCSYSCRDFPNVRAVAQLLANGDPTHEQQLTDYAKVCVDPAYMYFRAKFDHDLKPAMDAFKAAQYILLTFKAS